MKKILDADNTLSAISIKDNILSIAALKDLVQFGMEHNSTEIAIYDKIMKHNLLSEGELETACRLFNRILEANHDRQLYSPRLLKALYKEVLVYQLSSNQTQGPLLNRTVLLNLLIRKYKYKSYLEIGVYDPALNFDDIKCKRKTGIDPTPTREDIIGVTSDEFFNDLPQTTYFDLVFIDGLHHADQVERDIANALKHLSPNGTVVCHDMLPENEQIQTVPYQTTPWMGDCWKAWVHYRCTDSRLSMYVVNADCGLGVIRRGSQELFKIPGTPSIDFPFFERHRDPLMNVISVFDFHQKLNEETL